MSLSSIIRAASGGPKKTRAEGDQPEEDQEDDGPVSDNDESAEGEKPEEDAAAEDDQREEEAVDDDDADEKMSASQKAAFAAGRRAGCSTERKRIAAIMGNPAADANPALAAHLAFATGMNAADARAALTASSPAGGKLAGKMAAAGQPRLGGAAAPVSPTPGDKLVALASTRFARGKAK